MPEAPRVVETFLKKRYPAARYAQGKTYAALFAAGAAARPDDELAPQRAAAMKLLGGFRLADLATVDLEALALAEVMLRWVDRDKTLIPAIAVERGLADAVAVAWAAGALALESVGGFTSAVLVVRAARDASGARAAQPSVPVRQVVCAAADDEYRRAREVAARLRAEAAQVASRAVLAFAFPDERWGEEDLAAWLAAPPSRYVGFLLSTVHSGEVAARYVAVRPEDVAYAAIDLALALEPAVALDVLEAGLAAALKKPSYGRC
jgi:hypothetical protein